MKMPIIHQKYLKPFNKKTAKEALREGLAVINVENDDGKYFLYLNEKYDIVEVNGIRIATVDFDEESDNNTYKLYEFNPTLMPKKLWKSNIKKASIKEIYFKRIYSQGHVLVKNNFIWCICEYVDDNGGVYSVRFEKCYTRPKLSIYFLSKNDFLIKTKGVHPTVKCAELRLRGWVDEQIGESKTIRKSESKQFVRNIIENYPEIFI